MRKTKSKFSAMLLALVGMVLLAASPAGAQGYEGTSLEDGIFYVPADVVANAEISFSVESLLPNSDLTFTLTDALGQDAGDVEVQGAVVMRVDATGNFTGQVTLPSNLGEGSYVLSVAGTRADGSDFNTTLSLAVSDGDAASDNANDGVLALTGSNSKTSLWSGVLLVGFGLGLVLFASRAQRSRAVKV